MTDGFHLVVDALKLNAIDTIYGVAGIPITDFARLARAEGMRLRGTSTPSSHSRQMSAMMADTPRYIFFTFGAM
jgi:thiamine pyrophosphate-dependent acetolactate synthase large subunit-like protein